MSIKSRSTEIYNLLESNADYELADRMQTYMKELFPFFGIAAPLRKILVKQFWTANKQSFDDEFRYLIRDLWSFDKRECQYFAMDLLGKHKRGLDAEWIEEIEGLITKKSWWDSVDFLASTCIGQIFKSNPELVGPYTDKWMSSNNLWLQRTCLIYQLKYKDQVDFDLLSSFICELKYTNEFFINKAIGWALRQYSKSRPDIVTDFLLEHPDLSNLSKREASKYL